MNNRIKWVTALFVLALVLVLSIPVYASPNTNRGYYLNSTDYDGLHAVISTGVGTGSPPAFAFSLKSPDVYQKFASGQLHPKESCLSVDVLHERLVGASTTTHKVVIGVFCSGGGQSGSSSYDLTDSTFRGKYVRTNSYNDTGFAFQDEVIEFRVIKTDAGLNQWGVYAYNFNTSTYDLLFQKYGTSLDHTGWADVGDGGYTQDATMSCPTLYPWGIFQVRAIQKRVSGTWYTISSSDITANITDSWPCISTNNYQQITTYAWQIKIEPYGVTY